MAAVANPQPQVPPARQTFALPSCTPADTGYPNIPMAARKFSSKRPFKRVNSAEENNSGLLWNLKKYWGYSKFRGPQLDICRSVIRDRDVLVVAPTGIGKSLCFQVPAVTLEFGVTLVVSPLKALMYDQVNALVSKGVKAMMACNDTSVDDVKEINRQLRLGHPQLRLLYITPESLFTSHRYKEAIRACYDNGQMRRLVIDEAHCIDEWGRTFRPSYRLLGDFRSLYPRVPITALTASATRETRQDILELLCITKENLDFWVEPCNRKNLFYEVLYRGPEHEESLSTEDQIITWIKKHRPGFSERNAKHGVSAGCVTGLVYCRKRAQCEDLALHLQKAGMKARAYHADMPQKTKEAVQADWLAGRIEVVCATIAFGMGIDQAHVRYVIHYNMPTTLEGFYQETGRAGRDGHMSRCVLIYSREDASDHRKKLGQEMSRTKSDDDQEKTEKEVEKEKGKRRVLDSFTWLQSNYIENTSVCRHIAICRYFGEKIDGADLAIRQAYCNGMCDVCTEPATVARRAAMLNGEIEIASQVIREEVVEEEEDIGATGHVSSDPVRPAGTMAMLFGTARTRSSGIYPSSDNAPGPSRLSAGNARSAASAMRPPSNPAQGGSTPNTSSSAAAAPAPPIVPPSFTSQGQRRIGIVAYSSTVPSAQSSSIEHRPALADIDISARANEGQKRRRLALAQAANEDDSDPSSETGPSKTPRTRQGPKPSQARKSTQGGKRRQAEPAPSPYLANGDLARRQPGTRPRRSQTFTIDSLTEGPGEGSYALAAPPPEDAKKSKRQREAFEGVEAVELDGDGPFAYYNSPGVGVAGPSRDIRRVQGFRTPFRSPIVQPTQRSRVGPILAETRREALKTLQTTLLDIFSDAAPGERVWIYWECPVDPPEARTKGIKRVARELEAEVVKQSHTTIDFRQGIQDLCKSLKLLRIPSVLDAICGGELAGEFGDGEAGGWMRLVERYARAEAERS